jgi:uncharacterized Zn-binding protein involved in type VI secretion
MPGWSCAKDRSQCNTDHATGTTLGNSRDVLVNGKRPLCMSDQGLYFTCCGAPGVLWVVSEGSTSVLVNGEFAAGRGYQTAHQSGKGTLIDASANVLIGGPSITMEELARADALILLAWAEAALIRWTARDRQHFKEWFGIDSEDARQVMLERTRDMRDKIRQVRFEQCDADAYAHTWPWGNTIHLEKKFWTAKRMGPDLDSRAGTVIHEASHFWGSGSTQDRGYGEGRARNLARNYPGWAMSNADNNEYFYEDI